MSYQRERDEFMARCQLSTETARALLRHATTLQRLAEAQCNGDWPADGPWRDRGQQDITQCPLCESWWARSQIQGGTAARMAYPRAGVPLVEPRPNEGRYVNRTDLRACPDCRTEARVHALLEGTQWQAWVQGDPRGYVLKLFPIFDKRGTGDVGARDTGERRVTRDDMYCERVDSLGVPTR